MEGHCSTGQSPQWAVVPMEEEEEFVKQNQPDVSMSQIYFIGVTLYMFRTDFPSIIWS